MEKMCPCCFGAKSDEINVEEITIVSKPVETKGPSRSPLKIELVVAKTSPSEKPVDNGGGARLAKESKDDIPAEATHDIVAENPLTVGDIKDESAELSHIKRKSFGEENKHKEIETFMRVSQYHIDMFQQELAEEKNVQKNSQKIMEAFEKILKNVSTEYKELEKNDNFIENDEQNKKKQNSQETIDAFVKILRKVSQKHQELDYNGYILKNDFQQAIETLEKVLRKVSIEHKELEKNDKFVNDSQLSILAFKKILTKVSREFQDLDNISQQALLAFEKLLRKASRKYEETNTFEQKKNQEFIKLSQNQIDMFQQGLPRDEIIKQKALEKENDHKKFESFVTLSQNHINIFQKELAQDKALEEEKDHKRFQSFVTLSQKHINIFEKELAQDKALEEEKDHKKFQSFMSLSQDHIYEFAQTGFITCSIDTDDITLTSNLSSISISENDNQKMENNTLKEKNEQYKEIEQFIALSQSHIDMFQQELAQEKTSLEIKKEYKTSMKNKIKKLQEDTPTQTDKKNDEEIENTALMAIPGETINY